MDFVLSSFLVLTLAQISKKKENQPTLYQDVDNIFLKAEQGEKKYKKMIHKQKIEKVNGHGRLETRRYTLIMPREQQAFGIRWPHLEGIGNG